MIAPCKNVQEMFLRLAKTQPREVICDELWWGSMSYGGVEQPRRMLFQQSPSENNQLPMAALQQFQIQNLANNTAGFNSNPEYQQEMADRAASAKRKERDAHYTSMMGVGKTKDWGSKVGIKSGRWGI